MKRALNRKLILSLLIGMMMIALLQTFSLAASSQTQTLKLQEKEEYIIYVADLLDKEFDFAFSNTEKAKTEELKFIPSARDEEEGNHVAYVDETLYETYFEGKEHTYLWVKQGETELVKAEEITLKTAMNEEKIQAFNKATKTIDVTVGEKELPTETKEGVTITHKIGTLQIKANEGATYTYQLVKAEENTEAARLIELANQMNTLEKKNMYEKLAVYSEFETLYNKLMPSVENNNWLKAEENTIPQPQEAKEGDQYIVWVKQELGNEEKIDIQIMTCRDDYTPEYESKDIVIKETSRLPITYDNIILFVIAGVLLILIIAIIVLKLKNKNSKH